MLRRKKKQVARGELTAVSTGSGLAVFGDPNAVAEFVSGVTRVAPRPSSVKERALDAAQLVASGISMGMNGQYVQLTPSTMDAFEKAGQVLEKGKTYSGAIRGDGGSISSFADFTVVGLGPTKALALQQMATTMALRAAIEEVAEAIRRVEGKLDVLSDLVRSERVGHAIGDYRFLEPLANRVDAGESLADDDWSTVQHLGAEITRDIEALRAFVRMRLADDQERRSTRSRADRLEKLVGSHLDEILGALLLCEHNLMTWHRLKLARSAGGDGVQMESLIEGARSALEAHRAQDQRLVTDLEEEIDGLTERRGLEGLAVMSRKQVIEFAETLNVTVDWFAEQRTLDVTDNDIALPGWRESLSTARDTAVGTAKAAKDKVAAKVRRGEALEQRALEAGLDQDKPA